MARRYSQEFHAFMAEFIPGHNTLEIMAEAKKRFDINMTANQVKNYRQYYDIRSGVRLSSARPRIFSEEHSKYIFNHYKGTGPIAMANQLNKKFGTSFTPQQIKSFYANHKLSSGLTGCFEKGHIPANKGKHVGVHPNAVATQFQPGNQPYNKLPISSVIVKSDGYLWRKLGPGNRDWRQEHILIWEAAHGPIPAGHVVTFVDGNKLNISLDNLRLISNAVNLELNRSKLRGLSVEAFDAAITLAELKIELRKKSKG